MESLDSVLEHLRSRGERITIPRRLVIEALAGAPDHLTISDIQHLIGQRDPDLAISDTTIYRVLQWLKDLAVVSQTDMGKAGIVYALISHPCHHHLICLNCGMTITLDDALFASLRQQLRDQHRFMARIDHMAIYGLCAACASPSGL